MSSLFGEFFDLANDTELFNFNGVAAMHSSSEPSAASQVPTDDPYNNNGELISAECGSQPDGNGSTKLTSSFNDVPLCRAIKIPLD